MAKQTFSAGQVLTAAQMTSLQQTAMGGGAATAKTSSYVLVAADAGTTVAMNAAGATTITVNTSLFSAGDTVYIQNLGAGVSTITAGTATVNTSASLALAQYEGGQLYFTSASAAIFIKGAGAVASSGGMTLLETLTLSGSSVTSSSIPNTYTDLRISIRNWKPSDDNGYMQARLNGDTSTAYSINNIGADQSNLPPAGDWFQVNANNDNSVANGLSILTFFDYANTATYKSWTQFSVSTNASNTANINARTNFGQWYNTSAISTITFLPAATFTSGTVLIYGVK